MFLRTLFTRHKLYSRLNILGFAFALTTVLFIGMYAYRELSMNMFHRDADRIYKISGWGCPYALAPTIAAGVPEIESITNIGAHAVAYAIQKPDEEFIYGPEPFLQADPAFFEVFTFPIVQGNPSNPLPDNSSIVLTERMAQSLFGSENPIGESVKLNNGKTFVVSAVCEDIPMNSSIRFAGIIPINQQEKAYEEVTRAQEWRSWEYEIFAKVRPEQDIAALNQKIQEVVRSNGNLQYEVERVVCYPLSDVYFNYADLFTRFKGGNHRQVMSMIWVGVIILLLAIVNFFNLSTAQATLRAKEIGLRKVNGATRLRLIGRFLGESVVMTFVAMILAVILVDLLMPLFNQLVGFDYSHIWMDQLWQWGVLIGGSLVIGILAGSYPAFYLSSLRPIETLYTGRVGKGRGVMLFRQVLIVIQLAASIGVIASTLIISAQLRHLRTTDLGFDKEQIVCIGMDATIYKQRQAFFSELRQLPFVQNISLTYGYVGDIDMGAKLQGEYQEEHKEIWSKFMYVDTAFFSTFGVEMVQGNTLSRDDELMVVLNEAALGAFQVDDYTQLKVYPGEDRDPDMFPVSGVCRNFNFKPLREGVEPLALLIMPMESGIINVRVSASSLNDLQEVFREIQNVYAKFNASDPLNLNLLDTYLAQLYHSEERFKSLFTVFSVLAMVISCFGIFGLIVFSNARRRKEIGVRKVQGATIREIVTLLVRNYLIYVGIAFVVATPVAYYFMSRWLQGYPYRIEPSLMYFVEAGLLTLAVVVLTVGLHSWIAARANPVESLRSE